MKSETTLKQLVNDNGGNAAFCRLFGGRIPLKTIECWKGYGIASPAKSTRWMVYVLSLAIKAINAGLNGDENNNEDK